MRRDTVAFGEGGDAAQCREGTLVEKRQNSPERTVSSQRASRRLTARLSPAEMSVIDVARGDALRRGERARNASAAERTRPGFPLARCRQGS
jgi:hypothetical protein